MTIDLWCLAFCALLPLLLTIPVAMGRSKAPGGSQWGVGNRETPLVGIPGWGLRAERSHANLLENLPSFAIAVLVVHVSGHHNDMSALGSVLFVLGRLLHPVVYMAGVLYLRTAVFVLGSVGMFIVLAQLFR